MHAKVMSNYRLICFMSVDRTFGTSAEYEGVAGIKSRSALNAVLLKTEKRRDQFRTNFETKQVYRVSIYKTQIIGPLQHLHKPLLASPKASNPGSKTDRCPCRLTRRAQAPVSSEMRTRNRTAVFDDCTIRGCIAGRVGWRVPSVNLATPSSRIPKLRIRPARQHETENSLSLRNCDSRRHMEKTIPVRGHPFLEESHQIQGVPRLL